MSKDTDFDYETLPDSVDELLEDSEQEPYSEDDDTLFDDDGMDESDDASAAGKVDADVDEGDEELDEYDDIEDDEEDDATPGNESGSKKSSIIKEIGLWTAVGAVGIVGATYYAQNFMGITLFGETSVQDTNHATKSPIEQRASELRNVPSSEIVSMQEERRFDVNSGWENNDGLDNLAESDPDATQEQVKDVVLQSQEPLTHDNSAQASEATSIESHPADADLLDEIRQIVDEAIKTGVGELLTADAFDQRIGKLEEGVNSNLEGLITDLEADLEEYIKKSTSQEPSDEAIRAIVGNRSRVNNIQIVDSTASGGFVVVRTLEGKDILLKEGATMKHQGATYTVENVELGGAVVLIDNNQYIDHTLKSREMPSPSPRQEQKKKDIVKTVTKDRRRYKAQKRVADSLIRDYSLANEARKLAVANAADNTLRSNDGKDYIMSSRPIDMGSEHREIPAQTELVIAKGWKGSMIMGKEFLVIDPLGNWRKLSLGDRVRELSNDLVHGLDNKNNLIVGNHVILFN